MDHFHINQNTNRYNDLFTIRFDPTMTHSLFGRPTIPSTYELIDIDRNHSSMNTSVNNERNNPIDPRDNTDGFKVLSALYDPRIITALFYDNKPGLAPIIGYAQEPLLPLIDACAPLVDIVDDILAYAQLAINETPPEPADDLTIDESAAIRLYTMEWAGSHRSLYSLLNRTLKNEERHQLVPYYRYLKLFLTAIVKIPCTPIQTVWRGVTKDMSDQFPRGTAVTWWGFSSCTTSLTVLENQMYLGTTGARTLFSVEAINARIIRAHSHFVTEDEVLLLPGTYMEVQSQFSPAPDLHVIHLKQLKPRETLLELPFEGALLYPPEPKVTPWYKKKRTIVEITLLVLLCIAGIIVGAVLGSRRAPPPPICIPHKSNIRAEYLWSFDCADAREDRLGLDNGTAVNGVNYTSPDFSGRGQALTLDQHQQQHVILPKPLNLTSERSFTVSFWIFRTGFNLQTMLTDCSVPAEICLTFMIGDTKIYVGYLNATSGIPLSYQSISITDVICQLCWIYLSLIYDSLSKIFTVYYNGQYLNELDIHINPNVSLPNRTTSRQAYIGTNSVSNSYSFNGLIDQFNVAYYNKNESEILDEATLLCSYTFENENVTVDSGPNNIPANTNSVYRLSSNNQSSLLINTSTSYFQFSGMTILQFKEYSYSIAFWLRLTLGTYNRPNSAVTILQFTSKIRDIPTNDYRCIATLHIDAENRTMAYFIPLLYQMLRISDFIFPNDTWTHVGISYNNADTIRMYINGKLKVYFTDSRFATLLSGSPRVAITFGTIYLRDADSTKSDNYPSMKCFAQIPVLNYTQMNGEIDDVNFYSRRLTDDEFASLATHRGASLRL